MIIPKKHKVWVTCLTEDGDTYVITADERLRDVYYLFKQLTDTEYNQVCTSNDPTKFYERIYGSYERSIEDD